MSPLDFHLHLRKDKSEWVCIWWGSLSSLFTRISHSLSPSLSQCFVNSWPTFDPCLHLNLPISAKHKPRAPSWQTTKTTYHLAKNPRWSHERYRSKTRTAPLRGVRFSRGVKFRMERVYSEISLFFASDYNNYTGSRSSEDYVHNGKDMLCLSAWLLAHKMWLVLAFCLKYR